MKLKPSIIFQFSQSIKAVIAFYITIFSVSIIFSCISFQNNGTTTTNSLEMVSIIFIFVLGLNIFKSSFHFGLANSVSRRTIFSSLILSIIPIASIMVFIDNALIFVVYSLPKANYRPLFYSIFSQRFGNGTIGSVLGSFDYIVESLLWSFFVYSMISILGLFITILYYRMNTIMKVIVSVGVPALLIIGIPFINGMTKGKLNYVLGRALNYFGGFGSSTLGNPYIAILNFMIASVILCGLSYLLIKRATIKEN